MHDLKKKEMEQLTFKPKTNETKNREVLNQIMRNEDLGPQANNNISGQERPNQTYSRGNSGSPLGHEINMRDEVNRGGLLSQAYSHTDFRNPNDE